MFKTLIKIYDAFNKTFNFCLNVSAWMLCGVIFFGTGLLAGHILNCIFSGILATI